MVYVEDQRRQTIIVRRIRVDGRDERHIWRLGCGQVGIVGLFRQALTGGGVKLRTGDRAKAKTNVDGLDPFGSLVSRKSSPLPTYARVGTNRLCADRCDCHTKE